MYTLKSMTKDEYVDWLSNAATKKELLEVAKQDHIVGRHDMSKNELIMALVEPYDNAEPEEETDLESAVLKQLKEINADPESDFGTTRIKRPKSEYIDNMTTGAIVAFKVNEAKVISGKVLKHDDDKLEFTIETKNGIRFMVKRKNIIWVKVGDKWPKGVYDLLVGGGKSYASAKEA